MRHYSEDGTIRQVEADPDAAMRVFKYHEPKSTGEPIVRRKTSRVHPKATGPDTRSVYHPAKGGEE